MGDGTGEIQPEQTQNLMGVLLLKLNSVPDDEAEDIRGLLTDHNINFYETSAGNWGVSLAAIWLHDEGQLSDAKALLDSYQQERLISARAAYREQQNHETFWDRLKANPFRALAYLLLVAFIGYVSLAPFLSV